MLDTPEGLVEACEKDMPYLWSELSKVLDTSDEAAYEKFFLLSQSDPRVPKRAGYYLGYLIAKELNRSYPLDALIRLDGPELQALIQEVVTRRRLE